MSVKRKDGSADPATGQTLQDIIDGVLANKRLSEIRRRDLRSAVVTYSKLVGGAPGSIVMDLAAMREMLDGTVPMQAKVSRKRWLNLRSDLTAAIAASGLRPMLRTADIVPGGDWTALLKRADDKAIRTGLSRLGRWATMKQLKPMDVDTAVLQWFFSDLEVGSLVRNIRFQRRNVAKLWNKLRTLAPAQGLKRVDVPSFKVVTDRIAWDKLPGSFRRDAEDYLTWCSVPDPLDEYARVQALAPPTLKLRRHYMHTAASAALSATSRQLISLARLVEPETVRAILRHEWERGGRVTSPALADLASTLIIVATEWVEAPADQVAELKKLRRKLGTVKRGMTEKNKALLRKFEDPQVLDHLLGLPQTLWRLARHDKSPSKRWFVLMQNAIAIDILLHVPLRIENLSALDFSQHLHWPQGRGKPALIVIPGDESKNDEPLEFELPSTLSERLWVYRHEIAPEVVGRRVDRVFVSKKGIARAIATLRVAIQRMVLRYVGVKITPHQFRHLAAKIALDASPGAYELVRQLLGHKTLKTTTRFYAGPDTRRAGRAHAELIRRLREEKLKRKPRPIKQERQPKRPK